MNRHLFACIVLLRALPVMAGQTQLSAPTFNRALAPAPAPVVGLLGVAQTPNLALPVQLPVAPVGDVSLAPTTLGATAPALEILPANASAESRTVGGRIVFDHAGRPVAGSLNATPVLASATGVTLSTLKPAAPSKLSAAAGAFVPVALGAAQSAQNDWIPALIMGALLIGVILLLRWSKKNLSEITKQEIAEFQKTIEARKDEWLKIPGVKKLEIVPIARMDDTPPAYLRIVVDHIGPDNKDLLPQNHQNWSPVIASMFPQALREAARIGSLDGKGYWPVAVEIAK